MTSAYRRLRRNLPPPLMSAARRVRHNWLIALARSRNVGAHSYVDPSAHVLGWRNVRIGNNCVISQDCWLNVNHRETEEPAIVVGDNCFIGKRNFFSSGRQIVLRDYCLTTLDCKFLGSSHNFHDPFVPYLSTGTRDSARIVVGVNCMFNVGSVVLGAVNIGHGSVIGAGAVVIGDVPAFSLVVGNPARVVRRFSVRAASWIPPDQLSAVDEATLPNEATYLDALRAAHGSLLMPLIAAGKSAGDLP